MNLNFRLFIKSFLFVLRNDLIKIKLWIHFSFFKLNVKKQPFKNLNVTVYRNIKVISISHIFESTFEILHVFHQSQKVTLKVFLLFSLFIIDVYYNRVIFLMFLIVKKSMLIIFWFACFVGWISFINFLYHLVGVLRLHQNSLSLNLFFVFCSTFTSPGRVYDFMPCRVNFFDILLRFFSWVIEISWASSRLLLYKELSLFLIILIHWSLENFTFLLNLGFLRNLKPTYYWFSTVRKLIRWSRSSRIFLHRIWEGARLKSSSRLQTCWLITLNWNWI